MTDANNGDDRRGAAGPGGQHTRSRPSYRSSLLAAGSDTGPAHPNRWELP
jgi:hypothetical protein